MRWTRPPKGRWPTQPDSVLSSTINKYQDHINVHETIIANSTKIGKDMLDISLVKKHVEFRNKIEVQRHIYGDLKNEFFKFLTKYM